MEKPTLTDRVGYGSLGEQLELGIIVSVPIPGPDFYSAVYQAIKTQNFQTFMEKTQEEVIRLALKDSKGNQTQAAKSIGLTFRQFRYLVGRYEINREDFVER